MKRALKSYWAFTKGGYRFLVLFLMPALAIISTILAGVVDKDLISLVTIIFYLGCLLIEPMSDYWFLGGFYNKKRGSLGFLQGSNHYECVIRDVVIVDLIRRACFNLGIYLVMFVISVLAGLETDAYTFILFFPCFNIFMGEIEIFIARHFDMWNYHYTVVFVGFLISTPVITQCILMGPDEMGLVCLIMAMLAVIVGVGIVFYTKKKVRDSYYDK